MIDLTSIKMSRQGFYPTSVGLLVFHLLLFFTLVQNPLRPIVSGQEKNHSVLQWNYFVLENSDTA